MSEQKAKETKSRREQENQNPDAPASDVYGNLEGKDPETGVEKPTEDAVEKSREWVNENAK